MRLVDEVEQYLLGTYNIIISNATMYAYGPEIDSYFLEDTPAVKKMLQESLMVGESLITIADMVYNHHDVKIVNRDKIPVMYERIEAYLDEAKGFYNAGQMDEGLNLKVEMLDNLAKVLLEKYKRRILAYLNNLDENYRPKPRTNFIKLTANPVEDFDSTLEKFKRDDKLMFTYGDK